MADPHGPANDDWRARALADPSGTLAELEGIDLEADPDGLYLFAELLARTGRSERALELIDRAEAGFVAAGHVADARRCDAGRTDVYGNLGRHVDAIAAATRYLDHLGGDPASEPARVAGAHANLGACLEDAGRYPEALVCHDRAIELAAAAKEVTLAALMQINRANVLNRLGRSTGALASLAAAAVVLEAGGLTEDLATLAINAGETACLLGDPDGGLAWFARATELVSPDSNDACVVLVESAAALVSLGAAEEAAARCVDALSLLGERPLGWIEARAWFGLGLARRLLGDEGAATHAFAQAAQLFGAAGNLPGEVHANLELASLDRDQAVVAARRALARLDEASWPVQATLVRLRLAELVDAPDERDRHLRAAVALADAAGIPHLRYRAHHRLGVELMAQGDIDGAAERLETAVLAVERLRRRLTNETVLRSLPSTTAAVFDDLVRVRLAQGRIAEALDVADRGRSRALVDLGSHLGQSGRDAGSADPEVGRLEADLDALYDQLLGVDSRLDLAGRRGLDLAARELEAALARRRFELTPPSEPAPAAPASAGSPPAEGRTVALLYVSDGDALGVFVRAGGDVVYYGTVGSITAVTAELDAFHAAGRRALALGLRGSAATAGDTAGRSATARLERLGALIPMAVWEMLLVGGADDVVVVPTDILHAVPWHALGAPEGGALVDLAAVSVTPSLALRAQRHHWRPESARTVVVGQRLDGLAGVERELEALASIVAGVEFLVDDVATLDAVLATAPGVACLHLASHGLFRPGAPLQSGVRLADGWLSAERASRIDLRGALVVLSACDTGRTVVAAGDELFGLQRGFFQAGASAVVMSLWPARDDACVELMAAFHRQLASGASAAGALGAAQREVRTRFPHPWAWAPFFLSGVSNNGT